MKISSIIIPLLSVCLVLYALYKKVNVYESFVQGAFEGLPILYKILPYMAAMLIVIQLLHAGGIMEIITFFLKKPCEALGVDPKLLPMILFRPLSGSAAMAVVADIFQTSGPDTLLGLTASTMMGSSETIFYTLALYFGSIGIQKTGYTIPVALIASFVSVAASIAICRFLFA